MSCWRNHLITFLLESLNDSEPQIFYNESQNISKGNSFSFFFKKEFLPNPKICCYNGSIGRSSPQEHVLMLFCWSWLAMRGLSVKSSQVKWLFGQGSTMSTDCIYILDKDSKDSKMVCFQKGNTLPAVPLDLEPTNCKLYSDEPYKGK